MKINDYLKKNSNNFYYLALFIGLLSFTWLSTYDAVTPYVNMFDKVRIVISLFFLSLRAISLFLIDRKYFIKASIIAIPFLISLYFCRSVYLIQSLAFVMMAYKVDKNKVLKIIVCSSIITYLVSLIGVLSGAVYVQFVKPPRFRCYFGFKHPSYFSIHFCAILFGLWYLYFKEKKILSIAIFELSSIFLYFVPNTRTSAIILAIFPIILLYSKLVINCNNNLIKNFTICLPFIFLVLSLILTFVVQPAQPTSFLETFTIRFTQAHDYYLVSGIHLFKSSKLWLDNMYMFLLENFGIVCSIVYIGLLAILNKYFIKEKNYYFLAIALFFLVYALMDNYGMNIRFNVSLLFMSDTLNNLDI